MFKLYISPSAQEANIGVDGISEENRMQAFGKNLTQAIRQVAGNSILVGMNQPEMPLEEIVIDSNRFGADAHLALHTNAASSPGVHGMEIYAHAGSPKGELFASIVARHLAQVDIPIRGDRDSTPLVRDPRKSLGHRLAEVDKVKAPACLVELVYHTNAEDLKELQHHWGDLIHALRCAVVEYVKEVAACPAS